MGIANTGVGTSTSRKSVKNYPAGFEMSQSIIGQDSFANQGLGIPEVEDAEEDDEEEDQEMINEED